MGQQHQAAGRTFYPLGQILTEGSLSTYQNQTGAESYTLCLNNGSLILSFAGYATKEAPISQGKAS